MKTTITLLALLVLALPARAGSGLIFDHQLHVEDVELECDYCHAGITESKNLSERYLPGKPECADCHDVGDMETCGTCHADAEDPAGYAATVPAVDLFSHEAHVGSMECAECHGGAPEYVSAPAKADCRGCHATVANYEDCSLCHSAGRHHVPESHEQNWETWHGIVAGSDTDEACMLCHVQDNCQTCHGGDNVRPRVHPVNFEFNHSIEAKTARIDCEVCHNEPAYCAECHAGYGIIPQNHAEPGWQNGQVHGPEALFEIESCIACHDAGEAVPASCAGSGCHQGG
jgi:hypothetical protein